VNEPGARDPHTLRLFFALWPSAAERQSLAASTAEAVSRVEGLPVPGTNLHVTLAFLGAVPGRGFGDLAVIGGQGDYPAVALRFDRLEYWAKPKVLVAMPVEIPATGREIVDRLWERLAALGFERESRPWRPHLTLARKVRRPPPENLQIVPRSGASDDPAPWELALVESTTHPEGARYKPLAEWPLGPWVTH
jgi:RNA 2',3'-cyclic 3'-phosphodiesterase